ncbi:FISUMP domain-containing protein [uncultured Fibrobacter sp.]|uniref:FISUMP domain-containing protein n=1 Tax=uncultured Fibrobacter sp. TaxID=261512 RepID=UPI0026279E5B|nr:FISUMP domain-containing protein [uncultured Fibrobacter sp.]
MKSSFLAYASLSFALVVCSCSDEKSVSGGTSDDAGIIAISDKTIAGVTQKGPLVKGSKVILKETSEDGSFTPTGKELTTKTLSNKGDFKFDSLELESQYILLSAKGKYTREEVDETSACSIRLDAVSSLEKRETVNINLLTHFEYKRVLNLVKEGKSFAEAKKQAATEVFEAFGFTADVNAAEDLNIYNTSEADLILYNISALIDGQPEWNDWLDEDLEGCDKLQQYLDTFTDDFADDGKLSDSVMQDVAGYAYYYTNVHADMEFTTEQDIRDKEKADPDERKDHSLRKWKKQYEFSKHVFLHYMDVEFCKENLWGEYREFNKPIVIGSWDREVLTQGYLLCNGFNWEITTKEHLDSLTLKIEHETGSMTDKRDGKKYKTVSFKYKGKKYVWMAEDLQYSDSTITYSKGYEKNKRLVGSYSWTTVMQVDDKYMKGPIKDGLLDSLHQGICPDGWHVSTSEEWAILLDYVGGPQNLLDETWRASDIEAAFGKDLIGVFFNKFDFNLSVMDAKYLETYYHAYTLDEDNLSYNAPAFDNDDPWKDPKIQFFDMDYPLTRTDFTFIEFSIDRNYILGVSRSPKAYVRCVKN